MVQPLPAAFGDSEQGRFRRFAKAILAVRKSEIMPAEEALSQLESKKQTIDAKIADVRRELAKRKSVSRKPPTTTH